MRIKTEQEGEWYKMFIEIQGIELKMDYKKWLVRAYDVFTIAKTVNETSKTLKKVELNKLLDRKEVKELIDYFNTQNNAGLRGQAALRGGQAPATAPIVEEIGMIEIAGEKYIHPYVALEILREFSMELKIEIYDIFMKQKIMEKRVDGLESYVEYRDAVQLKCGEDGMTLFATQNMVDECTRATSKLFNKCVGIRSIQDSNVKPEIHQVRSQYYEMLAKFAIKDNETNQNHIDTALMLSGAEDIGYPYRDK